MAIKLRELKRRIELEGVGETCSHFREALMEGLIKPDDVSIRDLAEAFVMTRDGSPCGREWVASLDPRRSGNVALLEADSAVDSSVFANLMAQVAYSAIMEGYDQSIFIHNRLCSVRQTKLKTEIIPGIAGIVEDMEDDIEELMPYPVTGFGEDYRSTPITKKKGRRLYVSKEAIFHDQTGLIAEAARSIGELMGLRDEKDFCRLVLGLVNNYKWRGTTYNTYQTAAPWINDKATNALVVASGWEQVDAMEELFNTMKDPNTGENITVVPKQILHMPARTHQFRQSLRATNVIRSGATTAAYSAVETPNTIEAYQLESSRWLYSELIAAGESAANAKDFWFFGDFQRAFECIENWPLTVSQMPANSEADFAQDIALGYKVSRKRVFAVKNPRYVARAYQAKTI